MSAVNAPERWSSRLGVILAVAGSAVGLGNFLRFPGLAAKYGSGAFMIAYFVSLLLIGIPICWAEWTLGRYAGQKGFRSSPGIFYALIRHPLGKYVGVLGVIIPVMIFMYYVYIEAWVLGYSCYFLFTDKLHLGGDVQAYKDFWVKFIGAHENGFLLSEGGQVIWFLVAVFTINFIVIYRGLARGIEFFCKYAMPALIVLALIILARVLTLGTPDPAKPDQNLLNGLGYMWNPVKAGTTAGIWEQLARPELWLAAAGQIFFSLSVGFGVIVTYASYLTEKDDVVLSGLTASSANEFCEVALGGMITVPAAFVFLGAAGVTTGFALGFHVLPLVFAKMPYPAFFGAAWFFLLFLAAVTSSLSMLQPGIAFLEEGLGLNRKQSVTLLGMLTAIGCLFVVYFSKDIKALDTIDFWVGTVCIFIMATILILVFGWGLGVERGWQEAHKGAEIRIPNFFKFVMKYLSPLFLLTIFGMFLLQDVIGLNLRTGEIQTSPYVRDLVGPEPNDVARLSVGLIIVVTIFFLLLIAVAGKRWEQPAGNGSSGKGTQP